MKEIFVDTLKDPYFDILVSNGASGFTVLVVIGDNIEKGLKSGKNLSNVGAPNTQKKFSRNFQKKRERVKLVPYILTREGTIKEDRHNL